MKIISRMHSKCEKCKHKDTCNNKRMVACLLVEMPTNNMKDGNTMTTMPLSQPASRKHTPITINMGEYGKIETSLEEMKEQFKKDLERKLHRGIFESGV